MNTKTFTFLAVLLISFQNLFAQTGWFSEPSGTSERLASIFFTDANTGWAVSFYDKLVKTTNGGNNWQTINIGIGTNENTIFFVNSLTGWTGGFNGKIGKSTNGGLTWFLQSVQSNSIESIKFINVNTGYAAGQSGIVLKTTNGGTSWASVFNLTVDNFYGLELLSDNILYVCGNNARIFYTINSGANWTMQNSGGQIFRSIKFGNSMTGYALGDNIFMKTTNGGITWFTFNGGLGNNDYNSVFFSNALTGWAIGGGAGSNVIKGTYDGGIVWTTQDSSSSIYSSAFFINNLTGWVSGENGMIKKTTTGGASSPSAPSNLSAISISSTKINLTWNDNSNNETYFKIERSQNNVNYTLIDSVIFNTTSYTDSSLAPNTGYFYRVCAFNILGNSNYSNVAYATTFPGAPGTTTLLYPANNSVDIPLTPFILWNNSNGATTYHLQLSGDSAFSNLIINDSSLSNTIYPVSAGMLNYNSKYYWRVRAKNNLGPGPWSAVWNFRTQILTGIISSNNETPMEYKLYNNYPNPFNPETKIKFDIPKISYVRVVVFDIIGREVAILVNKQLQSGKYEVEFDGTKFTSGVYFYRINTQSFTEVKKMILIR